MAGSRARRGWPVRAVQIGLLLALVAIAAYVFRDAGCLPGVDEQKAAQYAECLRDGRTESRAALAVLAVGMTLVVIGVIRLVFRRS
jgi:hypothetical protein